MSDTMPQTMQDKMRPLRLNYLRQLHERKGRIERLIALQEQSALSREDRAELKSQAHKLAGTGATYGFPKISEAGPPWRIGWTATRKIRGICLG